MSTVDPSILINLTRLVNSHNEIKQSIAHQGGAVSKRDGFEEFDDSIRTIPEGEGNKFEDYDGSYEVIPKAEEFTLPTELTSIYQDITIKPVPVSKVTNTSGGYTVTIL